MIDQLREMRLPRTAYAGGIGARIVFGYKLLDFLRPRIGEEEYENRLREQHLRAAQWIYDGTLALQGIMIKIGQTLGSRSDLVPPEYIQVLSRLQDQVPPRPWRVIQPHIESQLGHPIAEVFGEFEHNPIAAASLAQVYRARLQDGREVAVKVVYPNVDKLVQTDLWILKAVLWLEAQLHSLPLEPIYNELAANVPKEVDMLNEAQNMEAIASELAHRDDVVIPKVVHEWTRRRVLVMEYIDGIKITDLDRLATAGIDGKRVVALVGEVYMEQMLRNGHFQADPHPGNLFALPGNRLALLDFGLVKRFTPEFRSAFSTLARGIFGKDDRGLVEGLRASGFKYKTDTDDDAARAMGEAFRAFSSPDIYKDRALIDRVNHQLRAVEKQNPMVDMPGEIALAMRVMGLLLALIFTAGADVDFAAMILKYADEPTGVAT